MCVFTISPKKPSSVNQKSSISYKRKKQDSWTILEADHDRQESDKKRGQDYNKNAPQLIIFFFFKHLCPSRWETINKSMVNNKNYNKTCLGGGGGRLHLWVGFEGYYAVS